jgi:ethanolamine utilization cobalamin adenosyltransferase
MMPIDTAPPFAQLVEFLSELMTYLNTVMGNEERSNAIISTQILKRLSAKTQMKRLSAQTQMKCVGHAHLKAASKNTHLKFLISFKICMYLRKFTPDNITR